VGGGYLKVIIKSQVAWAVLILRNFPAAGGGYFLGVVFEKFHKFFSRFASSPFVDPSQQRD
jgi:hypothetical protein